MLDSKGLVHHGRSDLNDFKREFSAAHYMTHSEVFDSADVAVGLSQPGSFNIEDVKRMAPEPIIFTLANPTPEIFPDDVRAARPDALIATGRSDFDNQVNNVLGFPFIFRGAMDVRATKINIEMKIAAAKALAELAKKEVPEYLHELYGKKIVFGKEYIIPKPFDKRLVVEISSAVALAAIQSGASTLENFDLDTYKKELATRI
jgi:malate dehydrogenase (oxaloacetate-decarboxylating)/malate dehydrogenase (oxaloacetate-decarboxylating)(NADP+)